MKQTNRNIVFFVALTLCFLSSIVTTGCNSPNASSGTTNPPWQSFSTQNSRLIDNYINAIYADAQGRIWVATDSGASFFSYGSWSSIVNELSFPIFSGGGGTRYSSAVNSITQGYDQSIWFALAGGGIARYNQNSTISQWRRYTVSENIPSDFVLMLTSDLFRGEIWCATLSGVGRFVPAINEGGVWTTFTTDNSSLPTNQTRSVALNVNDNSIWIGTQDKGTVYFDGNSSWEPSIPLPPSYNYAIVSIAFDLNKQAWFGKWQGVSRLNTTTPEWTAHYTSDNTGGQLPSGPVNAVTTNFKDTRWFGTNAGLVRLKDTTWTTFNRDNTPQLQSYTITALTYDTKGNLWIGTANGVAVYNPDGVRY